MHDGQTDSVLVGLKDISVYAKVSVSTLRKFIAREGFPAGKIGGGWQSDKTLIDRWRLDRVQNLKTCEKAQKSVNTC